MPPDATASRMKGLDDARDLFGDLPPADGAAVAAVRARDGLLTKPQGALGELEALVEWLAAWQGRAEPRLERVRCLVFAGNHGVAARGVSAFPASVTAQMVNNFQAGGAAINQLCRTAGVELTVIPLILDRPTADMTREPALGERECAAHFETGFDAVTGEEDLVLIGEMGIGNTFSAAALCHALLGGAAGDWTGRGTGLDDARLKAKTRLVDQAAALHGGAGDGLEMLRRLGGRELAAMAGAVTGARVKRVPVLLDGYVAGAAALTLHAINPQALGHVRAAHVSAEPGHRLLLSRLGLPPLLDFEMRLGEASGAALAVPLIRAALACHQGMATFEDAGVAGKL